MLLLACSGPNPSATPQPLTGGTLRVAVVENGMEALPGAPYYDPAVFEFSPFTRCCLLRTLLSYNGRPTEEGGAELRPDLAEALPSISPDGLTWTFRLRPGLHYAPPLADRIIEARDFITALEHAGHINQVPFLGDIVGMDEFMAGTVSTIAGIEAPDATTLKVHLKAPAGDFGNRVATPAFAPLPAEALAGHDDADYAGFLVASGPYMYEGAESLALDQAAAPPIWQGHETGPVTLVRNPSWDRDSDPLRPAYVDRIEGIIASDPDAASAMIDTGKADVTSGPAPRAVLDRYLASDALRGRAFTQLGMRVHYMPMNLAMPPFDDVQVRRAVTLVIDREQAAAAIAEVRGTSVAVAHHVFPDGIENALLRTYDPSHGNDRGDVQAARAAMRRSRYDTDGDGRCDASACANVPAGSAGNPIGLALKADLVKIGIELVPAADDAFMAANHVATYLDLSWGADYPNAGNFAGLVGQAGLSDDFLLNASLIGAKPDQLQGWGYRTTEVPSLENKVAACQAAVGSAASMCWAELDQLMTERVMAWVPLAFADDGWIFSARVAAFSPGPESVGPALDQIQLRPAS